MNDKNEATETATTQAPSDAQILEVGMRHFKQEHDPKAEPAFIAAVREALTLFAASVPSTAAGDLPEDVTNYLKGIYAFLETVAPAGLAAEAFRLPPSPTRTQIALFDTASGYKHSERAGFARQDSIDRSEDRGVVAAQQSTAASVTQGKNCAGAPGECDFNGNCMYSCKQSTAAGERAPSEELARVINGMQKGRMSASAEPEYVRGYENGYDDARRQAISVIEAGAPGEFDPEERIRTWKQGLSASHAFEATGECDIPPIGWRCTRAAGHEGPCAAVQENGDA